MATIYKRLILKQRWIGSVGLLLFALSAQAKYSLEFGNPTVVSGDCKKDQISSMIFNMEAETDIMFYFKSSIDQVLKGVVSVPDSKKTCRLIVPVKSSHPLAYSNIYMNAPQKYHLSGGSDFFRVTYRTQIFSMVNKKAELANEHSWRYLGRKFEGPIGYFQEAWYVTPRSPKASLCTNAALLIIDISSEIHSASRSAADVSAQWGQVNLWSEVKRGSDIKSALDVCAHPPKLSN